MLPSEVIVNSMTLKVERENAKAMFEGYMKNGVRHFVTIFVANGESSWSLRGYFRKNPKLITAIKNRRNYFHPSQIGISLNAEIYQFRINRIAILDRIFHIHNDMQVWETLCNNGVFDIWTPTAPEMRVQIGHLDEPMILLLRLAKIDYDFTDELVDDRYFHSVPQRKVTIISPLIANEQFRSITELIRTSIHNYIHNEEIVYDTLD